MNRPDPTPTSGRTRRALLRDAAAVTAGTGLAAGIAGTSHAAGAGTAGAAADRPGSAVAGAPRSAHWVASWSTGQQAPVSTDPIASVGLTDQTVRHVLRLSAGGTIRVRFANPYGTAPVVVGPVTVARRPAGVSGASAAIDPATVRPVTFGGSRQGLLAAGASLVSDPVRASIQDGGDVVVSAYLPGPTGPVTLHRGAHATGYVSGPGDRTASPDPADFPTTTTSFFLVSGVDVDRADSLVIGAFGDSITEGAGTPDDTNQRWPDLLAERLGRDGHWPAVANLGISGNRLLLDSENFGQNAQARFDRDVLGLPNLATLIIFIGINDIQQEPHQTDPAVITAGYRQLVARAHDHGLRVVGATILPFEGWTTYTPELDAVRRQVNGMIRAAGIFDAVVDFDAALRDPQRTTRMLPAYDSGDGLHPNAAGAQALADAVDPRLLR